MPHWRFWLAVLGAGCTPAQAQPPAITQNGIVNAASQMPPPLASGALARGALIDIHGVRLGDNDSRVILENGGRATELQPILATPRKITALVPEMAPLGAGSIRVVVRGQSSAPFPIEVVSGSPGIFSRNGQGWGPGSIENLEAGGSRTPNTADRPVRRGGRVTLTITGAGNRPVQFFIGEKEASAVSRPVRAGRQEVILEIPRDSPQGCFVPIRARSAGLRESNVVTIAIHDGAGTCDAGNPGAFIPRGPRSGAVFLVRTRFREEGGGNSLLDEAAAVFVETQRETPIAPLLLTPPEGTCSFFAGSYQLGLAVPRSLSAALIDSLGGRGLETGQELTVGGVAGTRTIRSASGTPGFFLGKLGGDAPPPPARPPFLEPGSFQLSSRGGPELPGFTVAVPGPPALEWINREKLDVVDRRRPLPIEWRTADSGSRVVIVAMNVDPTSTAFGMCYCSAAATARHFSVPAWALANLPASTPDAGLPLNLLYVASLPIHPQQIPASGLHSSVAAAVNALARRVEFR
ncbi:MAG: hypothetical protein C5B51_10285 [Terriglobia bacterium]|nr:MAG: hypothetical protein C5B51_10285 [Terriglobia bacterium]